MKTKEMTPEKLEKKALRKQKEIEKWEREKARPKKSYYLIYLIFIVSLVYVTDEIASQIGTLMKTEIANDLMSRFGEKSVGMLDIVSFIAIPFQALSIFYKPLSDRFGRKLFLVVNTLGMSLGMLIIALSHGIALYIVGATIIFFFVPHDMQVVYVMESAPAKHRAKIYSIIKCVATVGIMLVPLMRKVLMTDASQWRVVYLVPAIVGLVTSFIALLLSRETDAFIESRLAYLHMSDEEIAQAKADKSSKDAQGGFIKGLKFAFSHKQLRWVFIATALCNFGVIITMHYQVVMSYGFAKGIMSGSNVDLETALNGASVGPVTTALFMFPIGSALAQLFVGFFADAIGRKKSAICMTALTVISFVLLTVGSNLSWSPYLVGICCGAAVGGYWGTSDLTGIMISESSPTNLRSSILSAQFLMMGVGYVVAYGVGLPMITVLGNTYVPIITLCLAIPGMVASLIVMMTKVHDTKGVDLDKVTGTEWD
ncbi:MFS transporter [uncultured Eubacterium sp.]|uniref:MFS transporter n=1 Tax=uncultured Eubacterium sp. TaxID=165185 RepID=UPI0015B7A50A|nr:MFS transporter [uncultured Eubacterium sp.]